MPTKVGFGQKVGDKTPPENQQNYDPETGKFLAGTSPVSERTEEHSDSFKADSIKADSLSEEEKKKLAFGIRSDGAYGAGFAE